MGPNGAGKTTLVHMLVTLIKPTKGTARINGFDILKEPDMVRKNIGMVFQDPSSDDILTGYENLKLHALMYGVPKGMRERKIKEVLELVDLKDRANDWVKKYSSGMRRRLELARGLLHSPRILFLDEPTLGLDLQTRERMWEYMTELVEKERLTIVLTTHDMEEANRMCDRVAIIDYGRIVVSNSPEKLKGVIGGDVIKLKVKEPNIEKLKKLDYIRKIEKRDEAIYLTLEKANEHLQEILKVSGEVESVELRSPTLNDVFLHYTGREIREDTPEGGYMERIMQVRKRR